MRELRLWHWRRAMSSRESEKFLRGAASVRARDRANFHIKAVQVLNDCFPIGDTAEQDDKVFPKHHSTKKEASRR